MQKIKNFSVYKTDVVFQKPLCCYKKFITFSNVVYKYQEKKA